MNNFKTFFAVIKAYCAINVLMLPMQFMNGGYLLSPIMLVIACFFECLCAIKLSQIAIKYNTFSYPQIANKALGPHGMNLIRIMIALAHF
jgi:amino acid permease